jgi:hypothetical protein
MDGEPVNSVFILGAGASAHAGVPLMAGFFDAADDIFNTMPEASTDYQDFKLGSFRNLHGSQRIRVIGAAACAGRCWEWAA